MEVDYLMELEDLKDKELDFSLYHPIDHTVFSNDCYHYHGGPLRHLRLWWTFSFLPDLRRRTTCLIGLHRKVTWVEKDVKWPGCSDCGKRLGKDVPK